MPALRVPRPPAQFGRPLADREFLFGVEQRAGRFLDHLLVPALKRAIPKSDRPHAAMVISDNLYLDVTSVGDLPFEEHGRIAERLPSFCRAASKAAANSAGLRHPSDSPATATRGCLDEQGVAEASRDRNGCIEVVDRPSTPRHDGEPGLFG